MALLSSGLLYAASGLMKNGFYFTSMVSAIVAASLVASSKVYISLAYENVSMPCCEMLEVWLSCHVNVCSTAGYICVFYYWV